jgi:hypothetical protein
VRAGGRGVERQLAHRNFHAVGAQIAQAENALAVGDDDDAGLVGSVAQQLRDASAVVGAGFLAHNEQLLFFCLLFLIPSRLGAASPRRRSRERRAAALYLLILFELSALRLIWINKAQSDGR